MHDDPAIWSEIETHANVLVWDEVSMMWSETVRDILNRYPHHKHIFCGDPGFQLPPIRRMGETRKLTPFNAGDFPGHVEFFNESHRCKCSDLRSVLETLRQMITHREMTAEQIGRWIVDKFRELGRVITIQQAVEEYKIADMILVSRISEPDDYVKQYTDALEPRQPACDS